MLLQGTSLRDAGTSKEWEKVVASQKLQNNLPPGLQSRLGKTRLADYNRREYLINVRS